MPSGTILITGADDKYFDLAQGCIQSVRAQPQGSQLALAFVDMGCTDEQLAHLRSQVDIVHKPDWPFDFPARDKVASYLKGVLARPFLPTYFPGHEIYVWLDADAWVQDWHAIELLEEGARRRRGLAIVPEIDRASQTQYGGLPRYWDQAYVWYEGGHGREIAARLHSFPMLNSGAIALHESAPHWQAWTQDLRIGVNRNCNWMSEQIALNVAVYARGLLTQTELLPAWCNWTCHYGFPKWDEVNGQLVEPYLPHTRIGIMHLTVHKQMHANVTTLSGNKIELCVRYPAVPSSPNPQPAAGV